MVQTLKCSGYICLDRVSKLGFNHCVKFVDECFVFNMHQVNKKHGRISAQPLFRSSHLVFTFSCNNEKIFQMFEEKKHTHTGLAICKFARHCRDMQDRCAAVPCVKQLTRQRILPWGYRCLLYMRILHCTAFIIFSGMANVLIYRFKCLREVVCVHWQDSQKQIFFSGWNLY